MSDTENIKRLGRPHKPEEEKSHRNHQLEYYHNHKEEIKERRKIYCPICDKKISNIKRHNITNGHIKKASK